MTTPAKQKQWAPLFNSENREALNRLFQGYLNDYGEKVGQDIIKTITMQVGGFRVSVPDSDKNVGCRYICESSRILAQLKRELIEKYQAASGMAIMNKLLVELAGRRMYFPDFEDLWQEERNAKIRGRYNGQNIQELCMCWGLSERQVRRILSEGE